MFRVFIVSVLEPNHLYQFNPVSKLNPNLSFAATPAVLQALAFYDQYVTPIGFRPDVIPATGSNLQRDKTEHEPVHKPPRSLFTASLADTLSYNNDLPRSPGIIWPPWRIEYIDQFVRTRTLRIFLEDKGLGPISKLEPRHNLNDS